MKWLIDRWRWMLWFSLIFISAIPVESQTLKPGKAHGFFNVGDGLPRKHFFSDPKWWIGESVVIVSHAADAYTTTQRPHGIIEGNNFIGINPSNKKVALVSLTAFSIQTTLHAGAWHVTHHVPLADGTGYDQDHLGWRIVGYTGIPVTVALINGRQAIKNYQLIKEQK